MPVYSPGLEGVIAAESSISSVSEAGLLYRGYPIAELVERCSYEEVAYLLLHGDLPDGEELDRFQGELSTGVPLPGALLTTLGTLDPRTPPMDALRTLVSLLAPWDAAAAEPDAGTLRSRSACLLQQIPALVAVWHQYRREGSAASSSGPYRTGAPEPPGEFAGSFLRWITGKEPDPEAARLLDMSLILSAEHELNASTFAARVTVSTLSDLHSGVVSAIGTLKGPLHGGANEAARRMLEEIGEPQRAECWVRDRVRRGERIMGFGHRVLRQGDSRAELLHRAAAELARRRGETRLLEIAEQVQAVVAREKGLKPNLDFPCAWAYALLGIPVELYTPVFVAARTAGWCAHIIEQLEHNRLIRPRALYVGEPLRHLPPRPSERPAR